MKNIVFLSMCVLNGINLCAADAGSIYEKHCDNASLYRAQWRAIQSQFVPQFDRKTVAIPVLYFDVYYEGLIDMIPRKYASLGGSIKRVRESLIRAIPLSFSPAEKEGYLFIIDSFLRVYTKKDDSCVVAEEKLSK